MKIPPILTIEKTIKAGSVYYFPNEKLNTPAPHFHIVLNNDPQSDELILLVISSSKVEIVKRRRKNEPKETLVEIPKIKYPEFSVDSIIDCNNVFVFSKKELISKYENGSLKLKTEFPPKLVQTLTEGVLMSRIVEKQFKRILKFDL